MFVDVHWALIDIDGYRSVKNGTNPNIQNTDDLLPSTK